jgi:hypothetical protein
MLLHVIKSEHQWGSCTGSPICSHTAASIATAAPIQSYPEFKKAPPPDSPCQSCICCYAKVNFAPSSFAPTPGLRKEPRPLLEPRCAPMAYYPAKTRIIENSTRNRFFFKENEPAPSGAAMFVLFDGTGTKNIPRNLVRISL